MRIVSGLLVLTLAGSVASEHGGEVIYQAREGGGSNFTSLLEILWTPTASL